ncbi:hypothetical protein [Nocardioides mangrovi]|uniref:Uncharacterized protein n=1 Tax=Nocardioides mangrovi TaxID=2874580 RepID=A0ABS7UC17_9ACTN|nr:hypothetical protein [Nocardioides mangrovi]MBZ5738521.1 hypothetical protein [Nocardioides mangrovi]
MIIDFTAEPERLTTPFESWCAAMGIHPEALGAWDLYESSAPTAAAS